MPSTTEFNPFPVREFNTADFIQHVRKRPGMYIGNTDNRGLLLLIKNVIQLYFSGSNCDQIHINIDAGLSGTLTLYNIDNRLKDDLAVWSTPRLDTYAMEVPVLNALCQDFTVQLIGPGGKSVLQQHFELGELVDGEILGNGFVVETIKIIFTLDKTIWQENLTINPTHVMAQLKELAYIRGGKRITISTSSGADRFNWSFLFQNGLLDMIREQAFNNLGASVYPTSIHFESPTFKGEAALTFNSNSVDDSCLTSYVNGELTHLGGTHERALISGIANALSIYFSHYRIEGTYSFSTKRIRKSMRAAINVDMENPVFAGATRNKLSSENIIEPITKEVTRKLLVQMNSKPEGIQDLFNRFLVC